MCTLKLLSKSKRQSTEIPNRFIDEYMADANGSYVKVYLYLLRCLTSESRLDLALSQMADRLEYTEKDILRSLRYWAKKGILEFSQDEETGAVTDIVLFDLMNEESQEAALPENSPVAQTNAAKPSDASVSKNAPVTTPAASGSCSEDMLGARIEQLLGRTLSTKDCDTMLYICNVLQFPLDLVEYLYEYCTARGKNHYRYIETVALGWHEKGICTLEQAQKETQSHQAMVQAVTKELAFSGPPGNALLTAVQKWKDEWNLSTELVAFACSRAYTQTKGSASLSYVDTILQRWHDLGITTPAEVEILDKAHEEQQENARRKAKREQMASHNQFHNFKQRDYNSRDLSEMERLMQNN